MLADHFTAPARAHEERFEPTHGPLRAAAGSFSFSITATDVNGCTGSQSYTVNVLDLAPAAVTVSE